MPGPWLVVVGIDIADKFFERNIGGPALLIAQVKARDIDDRNNEFAFIGGGADTLFFADTEYLGCKADRNCRDQQQKGELELIGVHQNYLVTLSSLANSVQALAADVVTKMSCFEWYQPSALFVSGSLRKLE